VVVDEAGDVADDCVSGAIIVLVGIVAGFASESVVGVASCAWVSGEPGAAVVAVGVAIAVESVGSFLISSMSRTCCRLSCLQCSESGHLNARARHACLSRHHSFTWSKLLRHSLDDCFQWRVKGE